MNWLQYLFNSTYVRLARIWVLVKLSFYEEISTQTDYSNKLFQIKLKLKIFFLKHLVIFWVAISLEYEIPNETNIFKW